MFTNLHDSAHGQNLVTKIMDQLKRSTDEGGISCNLLQ